ncbi:EamA family transporter RarD [Corynebacterium mendelii]|uniref:EamA family transporter RarD n=1 Tax=Corynebacterium mendelii TaxID=2765362 RepID=A0A939DZT1_9CORY|nr:EamA family transporter RarD [Corynebacterium mendelii]
MIFGIAAYLLWGLFPAYFPLLLPAAPAEILAHRIIWTGVFMAVVCTANGTMSKLWGLTARTWLGLSMAGVFIAANWLIYVIAVNTGHVAEAAFGYFMNPLVAVMLGMVFLKEKLRPAQLVAVGIAVVAVVTMMVIDGNAPWIGLGLAFSFAFYGLIKKKVDVPAGVSLVAETMVMAPLALGYLVVLQSQGTNTFTTHGPVHTMLLVSTGVVTAIPLLLFGLGAKSIPLSTIGMLQYMTPTIQMLWAVVVMSEQLTQVRWLGFAIIWISVAIYIGDLLNQQRITRRRRQRGTHPTATTPAR